jgi:hypothetical protein
VTLSFKVDQALTRDNGAGRDIVGGPLLDLGTWADVSRSGVC